MSESAGVETIENPSATAFQEVVRAGQNHWRRLKSKPWKEVSQNIDLPEYLNHAFLHTVVDNLPDYIPLEIGQGIKESHPVPLIGIGILEDRRQFREDVVEIIEIDEELPEIVDQSEADQWFSGMQLLNEIATDTLALDILDTMAKNPKNARFRWFKPIIRAISLMNRELGAYKKGVEKIKKAFGGKEKYEEFRQSLIVSMLTGDSSLVDASVSKLGYRGLNRFAVELGKEASYSSVLSRSLSKTITSSRFPQHLQTSITRVVESAITGGNTA